MRNYGKIAASVIFVTGIMSAIASATFAFTNGPYDGYTNSPVDNKVCTQCHNSYELNTGTATFTVTAPSTYSAGETLDIIVAFSNSSTTKHGFELSAVAVVDGSNSNVGTFVAVDGTNTQTIDGSYIKHTSAGTANSSWSVQWTAPSSGVTDPVTFYAAGNEANGDNTYQNDYIYTATAQASSAATTPVTTPTLPPPPTLPPLPSPGASPTLPPPPPTLPPLPSPVTSPTPSECEPKSISTDTKKKKLKLNFGENKTVTVTVSGSNDCNPEGAIVNAAIKTGKNRVAIDTTTATTNANGQATFTITAGQKNGNSKVVFTVEDSEGEVYTTFIIVKIRKK